ncbi:MAG TPA: hypothetical protein VFG07_08870, partial [Thermoplasmata archaeon]|nr:hypothetical protein [Thermoplasmata archaeon]
PWMEGGEEVEGSQAELDLETAVTDDGSPPGQGPVFANKDRVRELAFRAFTAGKEWGTADDLIALARPWEKEGLDDRRVGMAMALLGVPNRRVRLSGKQCREYYFGGVRGTG